MRHWLLIWFMVLAGTVIRILPIHRVFDGVAVRFMDPDSYFHATLVQLLTENYPHAVHNKLFLSTQSMLYPYQAYDFAIASVAKALGINSEYLIDSVTAFAPVAIFLLTVPAVYLMGRMLFGKASSLISTCAFAVIYGEYLRRSLIGASDHHVAEVFLVSWFMVALVYAIKPGVPWVNRGFALLGAGGILYIFSETWMGYWILFFILVGFYILYFAVRLIRHFTWSRAMMLLLSLPVLAVLLHEKFVQAWNLLQPGNLSMELTMETIGGLGIRNMDVVFDVIVGLLLLATLCVVLAKKWQDLKHPNGIYMFAVWTVMMMVLTVIMRRFDYYLAVNLSLLFGWGITALFAMLKRFLGTKKAIRMVAPFIVALFLYWISASTLTATQVYYLGDDWQDALVWMRKNTVQGSVVATWWDYGYWVSHVAKQAPTCNPSQTTPDVQATAKLFMSNGDDTATLLRKMNVRYIVIDQAAVEHKLWAMAKWNGEDYKKYVEAKIVWGEGRINTYHPPYYETFIVSLFYEGVQGTELIYDGNTVKVWEVSNGES